MPSATKTQEIKAIRMNTGRVHTPPRSRIVWQSRYEGCVAVAYVHGKAIAGISGPWSDKFALTSWERPTPGGELELFDSLQAAKDEVERRTLQAGSGRLISLLRTLQRNSVSVARALLRHRSSERLRHRSAQDSVLLKRRQRQHEDTDLSGMYFDAFA